MKQLHELTGHLLDYWVGIALGYDVILISHDGVVGCYQKNSNEDADQKLKFAPSADLAFIDEMIEKYKIPLIHGSIDWMVPVMEYGNVTCSEAYGNTRAEAVCRYVIKKHLMTMKFFSDPPISHSTETGPLERALYLAKTTLVDNNLEVDEFNDEFSGLPVYGIKPEGGSVEDHVCQVFDDAEYAELLTIITPGFLISTITELQQLRKLHDPNYV